MRHGTCAKRKYMSVNGSAICSGSPLLPLPHIESQAVRFCRECYFAPFGEVQHVPCHCVHLLPCLVGDIEFALDDDLHLVVGVLVYQRRSLFEAVETCRYGFLRVDFIAGDGESIECIYAYGSTNLDITSPRKAFSLAMRGGLNVDWALGKCLKAAGVASTTGWGDTQWDLRR